VKRRFSAGDRVRVAGDFFWARGATGTVSAPPDAVTTISGPWDEGLARREVSALGTNTVYWSGSMNLSTTPMETAVSRSVKFGRVLLRYCQRNRTDPLLTFLPLAVQPLARAIL